MNKFPTMKQQLPTIYIVGFPAVMALIYDDVLDFLIEIPKRDDRTPRSKIAL
jgi:hypothetical protein